MKKIFALILSLTTISLFGQVDLDFEINGMECTTVSVLSFNVDFVAEGVGVDFQHFGS